MNNDNVEIELGNGYGYFCDIENQTLIYDPTLYINRRKYLKKIIRLKHLEKTEKTNEIENPENSLFNYNYAICACTLITILSSIFIWKL